MLWGGGRVKHAWESMRVYELLRGDEEKGITKIEKSNILRNKLVFPVLMRFDDNENIIPAVYKVA